MKKIITLVLLMISSNIFACVCLPQSLKEKYEKSEFVATVKIKSIKPDSIGSKFRHVEFEIIDLYKGKEINSIKLLYTPVLLCTPYTPKNTSWLIYARKDEKGVIIVGLCSESKNLNRKLNTKKYPNAQNMYDNNLNRSLKILKRWKANGMKVDFEGVWKKI